MPKTEYEELVEQMHRTTLPTAEEAKRYYDDRTSNQPAPGADNDGNVTTYKTVAEAREAIAKRKFTFVDLDEAPADISDIDDWDEV